MTQASSAAPAAAASRFDSSLLGWGLLGFVVGLAFGAIILLFGFFCCFFTDVGSLWRDKRKRAFIAGLITGGLISVIVFIALFLALVVARRRRRRRIRPR